MPKQSSTAHIDRGLELMRQLRAAQSGQQAMTQAATAAPTHDGYCLKCGDKRTVYTEQVRASAVKGVQHHRGTCGTCGATVTTFKSTAAKKGE